MLLRPTRTPSRGLAALLVVLLLVLVGCSTSPDDAEQSGGDAGAESEQTAEPAEADPDASRFEQLLAEHRELDFDPGDEPTPDEAYAAALEAHEADLSSCTREVSPDERECERPASLAEDLEETINVQLLLDASGSMADAARGGTKMQVAQRVLKDFVATLPESANVSLRVFGHVGSGSGADKARSCRSTEQRVPFVAADSPRVTRAVDSVRPAGWTPLARAMGASRSDLARVGAEASSNFVYVLSDGIETCGGDPVAAARQLAGAGVGVDVNVVGFDVDRDAARQLRRAARAAGGSYADAQDSASLEDAFTSYDWAAWTRYYNCRTGQAYADYNDASGVAYGNYNCISGRMFREYNAITGDAFRAYNATTSGAYAEYNAITGDAYDEDVVPPDERDEVLELARDRRDRILETARVLRDYVVDLSRERRDAYLEGAREQRTDLIEDAQRTRDEILEEAREARDAAQD